MNASNLSDNHSQPQNEGIHCRFVGITRSALLISIIAMALLPLLALAQVNYDVDSDIAYVAESPHASGNIVIAPTYNGYPVLFIGNSAFNSCSNLTGVTIPNSITNIGNDAFYACTNLMDVTFGNGVAGIGDYVFYGCQSLTNITIPDSVTSMGWFAFGFCTGLTSVTIGDGVTGRLGAFNEFAGCENLRNVTLGSGINNIEGLDWHNLPNLTNITVVASNLTYSSINGVLFDKAQTTLITFPEGRGGSYVVPAGVTIVGNNAFYFCTRLNSVTLPNGLAVIGAWAFYNCSSLMNVAIPASVTVLGDSVFGYCSKLPSVTIPSGVNYVNGAMFDACTSLTNITVAASNQNYSSINGVLFNKAQSLLLRFPEGRVGSYGIPSSVLFVGWSAFANCSGLTSVIIPSSVTYINSSAFKSCTNLTNVTVGINVANIDQSAFSFCSSLTSVTIPASVTNIGSSAFSACVSLTNLTFLGDRPTLGGAAFSGVAAGAKVYYYHGTAGWSPAYGGLPTVMLYPRPYIASASIGLNPDGFGFSIAGIPEQIIVVEASTNLVNWQPVWTNILAGVSTNFADPQWTNYPTRFYRVGGRIFSLLLVPNLSGSIESQTNFVVSIPTGKSSLQIRTTGGTGDCALFVRFGAPPAGQTWDYGSYEIGNEESVTIPNPAAGDWYIMVYGYEDYSGVTLRAK